MKQLWTLDLFFLGRPGPPGSPMMLSNKNLQLTMQWDGDDGNVPFEKFDIQYRRGIIFFSIVTTFSLFFYLCVSCIMLLYFTPGQDAFCTSRWALIPPLAPLCFSYVFKFIIEFRNFSGTNFREHKERKFKFGDIDLHYSLNKNLFNLHLKHLCLHETIRKIHR